MIDKNSEWGESTEKHFNNLTITKVSYPNGRHSFTFRATKSGDTTGIELAATPAELVNEFRLIVRWFETAL